AAKDSPDGVLYSQLSSLRGPLVSAFRLKERRSPRAATASSSGHTGPPIGLDLACFGKQNDLPAVDDSSIAVRAPSVLELPLPAELVAGCEFVTSGALDSNGGAEGTVQLQLLAGRQKAPLSVSSELPVIVREGSKSRRRFESAFDEIRRVFPPAL